MLENRRNWAGNYTYSAARWHEPESVEQVQALVRRSQSVKVLGTRHAFNGIADTTDDMLSLARLDPLIVIDAAQHTVTVGGNVRYGHLCEALHRAGFALHNLASLPHISVAGACATATHGSGEHHGNLATVVTALELVTADGEIAALSREHHGDQFDGAVVGLGGLGVITQLTLEIVPAFEMRQDVYEDLPLLNLEDHFDTIQASGYSVSLFTDWASGMFDQVWVKRRVTDGESFEAEPVFCGATRATGPRHPIAGLSPENCTEQMGIPGPWHERLPHFRMNFTPSSGEELQSEYFVPREYAIAAFHAIDRIRDHVAPLLQISEVRTIAADSLWMSPCYQQDCIAIHFTWHKNWHAVKQVLPVLEEVLAPFNARPHWGKLFTMSPTRLQALYPKLPDFQQLLTSFDAQDKFRNAFLNTCIFGAR